MIDFVKGKKDEGTIIMISSETKKELSSAEFEELIKDHDLIPAWSATGELYFTVRPKEKPTK